MATETKTDPRVGQVRLVDRAGDWVMLSIPDTHYRLHLKAASPLEAEVGRRVRGVIRVSVWKVDFVSRGGAYIEPLFGRPRRVQGRVIAHQSDRNGIVLGIAGCPITADLPDRWQASQIPLGTRIGVEVHEGATFEVK